MKNRRLHISRVLAGLMLWVFSLAVMPWSALHQHSVDAKLSCATYGEICAHKTHIANETHHCLVCSAHFEKEYYTKDTSILVMLPVEVFVKNYILVSDNYVALVDSYLRGPPLA